MQKPYFNAQLQRKLLIVAAISLLLASAMELYTFGIASDFFSRWFRSFFVIFFLIAIIALAIVPGVNILVNWFSRTGFKRGR